MLKRRFKKLQVPIVFSSKRIKDDAFKTIIDHEIGRHAAIHRGSDVELLNI